MRGNESACRYTGISVLVLTMSVEVRRVRGREHSLRRPRRVTREAVQPSTCLSPPKLTRASLESLSRLQYSSAELPPLPPLSTKNSPPTTMTPPPPQAIVSPSVLASNFADLGNEIRRMMHCGAQWVHMGKSTCRLDVIWELTTRMWSHVRCHGRSLCPQHHHGRSRTRQRTQNRRQRIHGLPHDGLGPRKGGRPSSFVAVTFGRLTS